MTTIDRFDPFERRIGEALDGIAPLRRPEYLDDILQLTARSPQRPRWIFLERWLPVDTTLSRPTLFGRIPIRQLAIVALLIALATAAVAAYVGSQKQVPAPFGLAANGQVAYVSDGDIYVRDTLTGQGRALFSGPGEEFAPAFSPDGTRISYVLNDGKADHFMAALADGSKPVELALIPATGNAQANWSPDSTRIALVYDVAGSPQLSVASVADGSARVVPLGDLRPWDVLWAPPNGDRLLIRAAGPGDAMDIYTVQLDGSGLTPFGMPRGTTGFGPQYTLSGLAFSPDGRTVAYNSIESETVPVAGSSQIVDHFRVGLVNADGSGNRAVSGPSNPFIQEGWPTYSPDGKWIVVHRWVFRDDAAKAGVRTPEGWIAIMPADGSAPARDIGPKTAGGEETGIEKTWSPDGTRILMSVGNIHQVFSVDPTTGASELVPWTEALPGWQRLAQ